MRNKEILVFIGIIILIVILTKSDMFEVPFQAMVDLIDPETGEAYICTETFECYQNIPNIPKTVKVVCELGICIEVAECQTGESEKKSCWDGSHITTRYCEDGKWLFADEICPPYECVDNSDCLGEADMDCDKKVDLVHGICTNHKCSFPAITKCSKVKLYWGQYKLWIVGILGILFALYLYWEKGKKQGLFKGI